MIPTHDEQRACSLSGDGTFRFWLSCWWAPGPLLAWLMLNPASATDVETDLTFQRVRHFTKAWGFPGFVIVNVVPFRTPCPFEMWRWLERAPDDHPALLRNLDEIQFAGELAGSCVVAFGAAAGRANIPGRRQWLTAAVDAFAPDIDATDLDAQRRIVRPTKCLGHSKDGWPMHPMARGKARIANDQTPVTWRRTVLGDR